MEDLPNVLSRAHMTEQFHQLLHGHVLYALCASSVFGYSARHLLRVRGLKEGEGGGGGGGGKGGGGGYKKTQGGGCGL